MSSILFRTVKSFGAASNQARRQLSMATEEAAIEHAEKWEKISKVMCGMVAGLFVYNVVAHFSHHEHAEEIENPMAYMKIRSKPFPWSCHDCDLLDHECKRKCKEAKLAAVEE